MNFQCHTVYTNSVTTLIDDESTSVLFQNAVSSGQDLIDYKTYKEWFTLDVDMSNLPKIGDKEILGPFFNLVKAGSHDR